MPEMNFKEYTNVLRNEKQKLEVAIATLLVKFQKDTSISIINATIDFYSTTSGEPSANVNIKLDL